MLWLSLDDSDALSGFHIKECGSGLTMLAMSTRGTSGDVCTGHLQCLALGTTFNDKNNCYSDSTTFVLVWACVVQCTEAKSSLVLNDR